MLNIYLWFPLVRRNYVFWIFIILRLYSFILFLFWPSENIEQAPCRLPMSLVWIDGDRPLPVLLTDRWGRGHPRQRHGGVFVRVCRTGRCGECVIEVPQLRIVPPFSGLERTGAEQQPSQVMRCIRRYHPAPAWTVSVCGWASHWWWCHCPFICPRLWRLRWCQTAGHHLCVWGPCVTRCLRCLRLQLKTQMARHWAGRGDLRACMSYRKCLHIYSFVVTVCLAAMGRSNLLQQTYRRTTAGLLCKWLPAPVDFSLFIYFSKIRDDEMGFMEM